MKDGIYEIKGKMISDVAYKIGGSNEPKSQVILVFTDGTYFEFYSEFIDGISGCRDGGLETVNRLLRASESPQLNRERTGVWHESTNVKYGDSSHIGGARTGDLIPRV